MLEIDSHTQQQNTKLHIHGLNTIGKVCERVGTRPIEIASERALKCSRMKINSI